MSVAEGRVIFDSPGDGAWNMAVDQALLMSAEQDGVVTLRLYRWVEPTLSLGYFQKYADRQLHSASLACPVVRRRSGGGAILHDQELTYSLVIPRSNRWSNQNAELYDLVHQVVIQLLARDGIESKLFKDTAAIREVSADASMADNQPQTANLDPVVDPNAFLCFQRRSDGDLVVGGIKVLGSAQRRLKHSLLQHGSLLLRKSEFAPELPGLAELGAGQAEPEGFSERLSEALGTQLGLEFSSASLTESEVALATGIVETTFGSDEWTQKR